MDTHTFLYLNILHALVVHLYSFNSFIPYLVLHLLITQHRCCVNIFLSFHFDNQKFQFNQVSRLVVGRNGELLALTQTFDTHHLCFNSPFVGPFTISLITMGQMQKYNQDRLVLTQHWWLGNSGFSNFSLNCGQKRCQIHTERLSAHLRTTRTEP